MSSKPEKEEKRKEGLKVGVGILRRYNRKWWLVLKKKISEQNISVLLSASLQAEFKDF